MASELAERTARMAQPIFEAYDWQWASTMGVPTVEDLGVEIDRMIKGVTGKSWKSVMSGRLRVTADDQGGVEVCIELGVCDEWGRLFIDDDPDRTWSAKEK